MATRHRKTTLNPGTISFPRGGELMNSEHSSLDAGGIGNEDVLNRATVLIDDAVYHCTAKLRSAGFREVRLRARLALSTSTGLVHQSSKWSPRECTEYDLPLRPLPAGVVSRRTDSTPAVITSPTCSQPLGQPHHTHHHCRARRPTARPSAGPRAAGPPRASGSLPHSRDHVVRIESFSSAAAASRRHRRRARLSRSGEGRHCR